MKESIWILMMVALFFVVVMAIKFIVVGVIIVLLSGLVCFRRKKYMLSWLSCLVRFSGMSCLSVATMVIIVVTGLLRVTMVITTLSKCAKFRHHFRGD